MRRRRPCHPHPPPPDGRLRSLLRQPHGFEGVSFVREQQPAHDLPPRSVHTWTWVPSNGTPLPLPLPRSRTSTITSSPASRNPWGWAEYSAQVPQYSRQYCSTTSRPRPASTAPGSSAWRRASNSTSSTSRLKKRVGSPEVKAQRASSTFSCDIAYGDSPTASRASASVEKLRHQTARLSRHFATCHAVCSI